MSSLLKETGYLIPDVLKPGLDVVFCGTALGHESARQRAYYAHPGNAFWPALHRLDFTPERIAPKDYIRVLDYGIGLTDMCKTTSGNDHELPHGCFDAEGLYNKIMHFQPRYLAFTSKNAASAYLGSPVGRIAYGEQETYIGGTRMFVLSSPSGQARRWWREDVWETLASKVHGA